MRAALCDSLQRICDAYAENAAIQYGQRGLDKARRRRCLDQSNRRPAQDRAYGKLYAGKRQRVDPGSPAIENEDVCGPEESAAEHQNIAPIYGHGAGKGKEVQSCKRADGTNPRQKRRATTYQRRRYRNEDNIDTGDETGLASRGELQPGLLKAGRYSQYCAGQHAWPQSLANG